MINTASINHYINLLFYSKAFNCSTLTPRNVLYVKILSCLADLGVGKYRKHPRTHTNLGFAQNNIIMHVISDNRLFLVSSPDSTLALTKRVVECFLVCAEPTVLFSHKPIRLQVYIILATVSMPVSCMSKSL